MENSSRGCKRATTPTVENQPSLRVFEGYAAACRRESESFRKASGSFSFENRATLHFPPPPPPLPSSSVESLFPAPRKRLGCFSRTSFRSPPPSGRTDRKQRIDTFDAFASCALDFSRPLIEGGSALTRSIWNEEWKLGVQTVSFGQTNSFFPAVSAGEEATIESGIFSTSLHSYNRHSRFYHCYTYICIDSCYIVGTRLVTILNDRYECKGLN